jgi:hypothetical protein
MFTIGGEKLAIRSLEIVSHGLRDLDESDYLQAKLGSGGVLNKTLVP